jgi:hypothetical protein
MEVMRMTEDVARLSPLPMRKLGASEGKNDHVEISPPMFPNMTFLQELVRADVATSIAGDLTYVPMALDRAVSETTLAATWALQRAPNAKAPDAMMKVAP